MTTATIDAAAKFSSAAPASRQIRRFKFTFRELNARALQSGHVQRVTNGPTRTLELFHKDDAYWVRYTDTDRVPMGRELRYPHITLESDPQRFQSLYRYSGSSLVNARIMFNCVLSSALVLWYDILGNYDHVMETVTCVSSYCMAQSALSEYRYNEPGTLFVMRPIRIWEEQDNA